MKDGRKVPYGFFDSLTVKTPSLAVVAILLLSTIYGLSSAGGTGKPRAGAPGDPVISIIEHNNTMMEVHGDMVYIEEGGSFNISIEDDIDSYSHFSSGTTSYSWDGQTSTIWDGKNITVSLTGGAHRLNITASDSNGNLGFFEAMVNISIFLVNTTVLADAEYKSQTVLVDNATIGEGYEIKMINCSVMFIENGSFIHIEKDSTLNISGTWNQSVAEYNSTINTMGGAFHITGEIGSSFISINTEVTGDEDTYGPGVAFDLFSGIIRNNKFNDMPHKIRLNRAGYVLEDSMIEFSDSRGGIVVDMDHTYGTRPVTLRDISMTGSPDIGIEVIDAAVWSPREIDGRDIFYSGEGQATYVMKLYSLTHITDWSSAYMVLPHFVNSMDENSSLYITYRDSSFNDLSSFTPVRNVSYNNWTLGSEMTVDLSSMTGAKNIHINWSSAGAGTGSCFISTPLFGDKNNAPRAGNPEGNTWTRMTSDSVLIDNVTIADSNDHFVKVNSSGYVRISHLKIGSGTSPFVSNELVRLTDSSITLEDTEIVGQEVTQRAVIHSFEREGDWGKTTFDNVTIRNINGTGATAIFTQGGWIRASDLSIRNCHNGIYGEGTLFDIGSCLLDVDAYGADIHLPEDSITGDVEVFITDLSITEYSDFGVRIIGEMMDALNVTLDRVFMSSTSKTVFDRQDFMGGLVIDVSSTEYANITVKGSGISNGPGHGIVLKEWDADGTVHILKTNVNSQDLDGIYLGQGTSIKMEEMDIGNCGGYGVYLEDNSTMVAKDVDVSLNFMGGMWMGRSVQYEMLDLDINNNGGAGIYLSKNCEGTITTSSIKINTMGIYSLEGNRLHLQGVDIVSNMGDGIRAVDTNLTARSPGVSSRGSRLNEGNGIHMTGGSLSLRSYRLSGNTNDGIYMEDVKLIEMDTPVITQNGANGLHIHFTSNDVLDSYGYYGLLNNINSYGNSWNGLKFTYDPLHLTRKVNIEMERATIHSNMGGDIISAAQVHIDWNTRDIDSLGSKGSVGVVRANMDINVEGFITIRNMNISLIGNDRTITVKEGMGLTLSSCDIRSVTPGEGFAVDVLEGATLTVIGGLLSPLSSLHAVNAKALVMTDALIRYGEAPVIVEGTEITLDGCRFEDVDGEALLIQDSKGNITHTSFSSNTIGIKVNGLVGDLWIENSTFSDNSWGVYLFDGGDHHVNFTQCEFSDNSPSGIRVKNGEAHLLDCDVGSSPLSVVDTNSMIYVKYTLRVEVQDEIGDNVEFDLLIEKGGSTTDHQDITEFISSIVAMEIDENGNRDMSSVKLTMTYAEGEEAMTITLDSPRYVIFNGYSAPVPTKPSFTINAKEDIGIDDPLGAVDVSSWFTDLGDDAASLKYTVKVGTPEIIPSISGSLLTLRLQENWWGEGNFSLTAEDPHGMSTTILVKVVVKEVNDVPIATNARIDPINPRSGDTIRARWEWSDVDQDNYQPTSTYFIKWYLNGVYQPQYDNTLDISGVKHEQIWNFTIYPADQFSWTTGQFGEGVSSGYVIVRNSPPVLDDVLITTRYPKTTTDLRAQPGEWYDMESSMVSFHYQWEILTRIGSENVWLSIGAPDSPVLSSQFTSKGDLIRVGTWAFDGMASSNIVYSSVEIQNSVPRIISAKFSPEVLDETVKIVMVENVVWEDDDGDDVELYFNWEVGGTSISLPPEYSELRWDIGGWSYPGNPNITVRITPKDDEALTGYGEPYVMTLQMTPMDTDGDGIIDMYDDDDDNDGFLDLWEEYLGTDPKSPYSRPKDTDMDGMPDGVPGNPEPWMDTDDDNDGIPDDIDTYPLNPSMPGDMDGDGIGDDIDDDIDGDGVPNEKDFAPYNPYVSSEPKQEENKVVETITLILLLLIVIAIAVMIILFLTGRLELPTTAPPPTGDVEDEGAEAIFDEDEDEPEKTTGMGATLDEFEEDDLESMKVCSNCGELVTEEISTCPNCGADFEDTDEEFDEDDPEE